jgi:hypothetical protein
VLDRKHVHRIDLSDIGNGIYIVQMNDAEDLQVKKVIIN